MLRRRQDTHTHGMNPGQGVFSGILLEGKKVIAKLVEISALLEGNGKLAIVLIAPSKPGAGFIGQFQGNELVKPLPVGKEREDLYVAVLIREIGAMCYFQEEIVVLSGILNTQFKIEAVCIGPLLIGEGPFFI